MEATDFVSLAGNYAFITDSGSFYITGDLIIAGRGNQYSKVLDPDDLRMFERIKQDIKRKAINKTETLRN